MKGEIADRRDDHPTISVQTTTALLETLSIGLLGKTKQGAGTGSENSNIELSFTAETEPCSTALSDRSRSWGSSSSSKSARNDGPTSIYLDMILCSSNDENDDTCEIWYADTPSTCGDKNMGTTRPEKRFFSDNIPEPPKHRHQRGALTNHPLEEGSRGSSIAWMVNLPETATSIQQRKLFSSKRKLSPPVVIDESDLCEI